MGTEKGSKYDVSLKMSHMIPNGHLRNVENGHREKELFEIN